MPKFTPGPWEYSRMYISPKEKDRRSGFVVNGPDNKSDDLPVRICDMRTAGDKGFGECEANAVLISKAPEMYAHLKEMTEADDLFPAGEDGERNGVYECRWCGREYHEDDGTWNETPRFCPEETCPGHQIRTLLAEIEG